MPALSWAAALALILSSALALPNRVHHFDKRATAARQHVHIPAVEAAGLSAYIERSVAFADASYSEGHTIPLTPVSGKGPSSRYVQLLLSSAESEAISEGAAPPSVHQQHGKESESKMSQIAADFPEDHPGSSLIRNLDNIVYMTPVTVGNQPFELVLDTGSSDTWLVSEPFQCRDDKQAPVSNARCKFAKHYSRKGTYTQDPHLTFNTAYADGEKLSGEIGYDTVNLGGIVDTNVTIALVHDANWHGDGISSGLLGMAFPSITQAKLGSLHRHYQPIFFDMYKRGLVAPLFSVALNRENEGPGTLSLGGLPPQSTVQYETQFASAPMQKLTFGTTKEEKYSMYVVGGNGFLVAGQPMLMDVRFIVDTGTTLSYVPASVMRAIEAAWSPPQPKCASNKTCDVPCDSRPPRFAFEIGGQVVRVRGRDMILHRAGGNNEEPKCHMGVAENGDLRKSGLSMIGGSIMRSFVSVFDVGSAEMRFANRIRRGRGNKTMADAKSDSSHGRDW